MGTHTFTSPKPADAKVLAQARLVITNGLGFEGWMDRLVRAAGYRGPIAVAATGVEPLGEGSDHGQGHGKAAHKSVNAHAWQSLAIGEVYVRNIVAALSSADPEGAAAFRQRGEAYAAEMRKLHDAIRAEMTAIPADQRRIITTHEALAYFGRDYGIEVLAAAGISTESEPTASNIARLTRQIKDKKVRAVFIENMTSGKLVEQLARHSGAVIAARFTRTPVEAWRSGPKRTSPWSAIMRKSSGTHSRRDPELPRCSGPRQAAARGTIMGRRPLRDRPKSLVPTGARTAAPPVCLHTR